MEGSHVELGAKFAKKFGENATVINAIESHHGDVPATSIIAYLSLQQIHYQLQDLAVEVKKLKIISRDSKNSKNYLNSLKVWIRYLLSRQVVKSRVIVNPEKIDDLKAHKLARDVKKKFETELTYPGHIKVTVIREIRANEIAK